MADRRLKDLRRRLALRRKQLRFVHKRIHALKKAIAKRKHQLDKGTSGEKAVAWLVRRAGWTESPPGSNDSAFLRHWREHFNMAWMKGQPWCGFACMAAYSYGAKKNLPQDTVSTVAIANRAHSGNGFTAVSSRSVRTGDLVVFNFGSGSPKHVGLARGPVRNGVVPTIEGNTSSSNSGSQSNGGGIFLRTRSVGLVHTFARPK